jgi:hypothetical protein
MPGGIRNEVRQIRMNRTLKSPVRQDEAMDSASPHYVSDEPVGSLGEFFERIEKERGPVLTAEDHRAIVEGIRIDRKRDD